MEYYIELLEFVLNTLINDKYKSTIIDILNEFRPKIYDYNILKQMNIIIENIENGSKNEEKEFYILKEMLEIKIYGK
jgi:hypothetical protein